MLPHAVVVPSNCRAVIKLAIKFFMVNAKRKH